VLYGAGLQEGNCAEDMAVGAHLLVCWTLSPDVVRLATDGWRHDGTVFGRQLPAHVSVFRREVLGVPSPDTRKALVSTGDRRLFIADLLSDRMWKLGLWMRFDDMWPYGSWSADSTQVAVTAATSQTRKYSTYLYDLRFGRRRLLGRYAIDGFATWSSGVAVAEWTAFLSLDQTGGVSGAVVFVGQARGRGGRERGRRDDGTAKP
jgi:hypothetical protein